MNQFIVPTHSALCNFYFMILVESQVCCKFTMLDFVSHTLVCLDPNTRHVLNLFVAATSNKGRPFTSDILSQLSHASSSVLRVFWLKCSHVCGIPFESWTFQLILRSENRRCLWTVKRHVKNINGMVATLRLSDIAPLEKKNSPKAGQEEEKNEVANCNCRVDVCSFISYSHRFPSDDVIPSRSIKKSSRRLRTMSVRAHIWAFD